MRGLYKVTKGLVTAKEAQEFSEAIKKTKGQHSSDLRHLLGFFFPSV
jgi:hypothetical protein